MRLKQTTIRQKVFRRFLIIIFLTSLLMLIIGSVLIVTNTVSMLTNQSEKEVYYIELELKLHLNTVQNFSRTIVVDPLIQSLSHQSNHYPETITELDRMALRNRIKTIIQSTPYIHSITLYNPNQQVIVTTDTSFVRPTINISPNKHRLFPVWLTCSKYSPHQLEDETNVFSYVNKFYDYDRGEFNGYIEVSITEKSVTNIYSQNNHSLAGHILITDCQGMIQSSDGKYPLHTIYPSLDFSSLGSIDSPPVNQKLNHIFDGNRVIFYHYLPELEWFIVHEIPLAFFLEKLWPLLIITLITSIGIILLGIVLSHHLSTNLTRPLKGLVEHIGQVADGNWQPLVMDTADQETDFLVNEFNRMIKEQTKLKNRLLAEQLKKQELSLELLQQQINPHFLYNALDTICALAELEEKETLLALVMNLSNFYRNILSQGAFVITVEQELAIIESYLAILHIRYHDRFDYSIDCPDSLKKRECLKLLLQPIVENSIYHGIKEISEQGFIAIKVYQDNNDLCFLIEDNGIGITNDQRFLLKTHHQSSFGLYNIDQRIKLYYGDTYGLKFLDNPHRGCRILIRIGQHSTKKESPHCETI